jgi:hypothetical protein
MAKKKAAKIKPKKVLGIPRKMDVASIEAETIKRVAKTISTFENFLTKWDASKTKPSVMYQHVLKIRKFHHALTVWQKTAGKKADDETRTRRLQNFVFICRSYS